MLAFLIILMVVGSYTVVKSVRDAVFLAKFGITQLSFIAIGLAFLTGIVVSVYLRLTAGMPRNVLILGTNTVIATSLGGIWLLLGEQQPAVWVPWALYIWSSIFGVFTVMQFWLLANDLFDPREAKRLFGVVGAGAILGGITGGFLSRSLATAIGTRSLLLVAAGMLVVGAVLANVVWPLRRREAPKKKAREKKKADADKRGGVAVLRDNPYVQLIATALLLSVLATTLLDWQFKSITKAHFAGRTDEMAGFFGALYGYLSIASFLLQTFVTGWLLRRFGVGVGLLLLPVSLLAGSMGILTSPLLPITALTAASGAKVAEGGLRFAIDKASMELMWLPVPPRVKEKGKAFVDTVVDRFATGLTGLLWLALAGAGVATAGRIHFISILVIGTAVLWLVVLLRARKAYVQAFRETLASRSLDVDLNNMTYRFVDAAAQETIRSALASEDPREVGFALYLIRDVEPLPDLSKALTLDDATVRCETLKLLAEHGDRAQRQAALPSLTHPEPAVREAAIKYLCRTAPPGGDPLLEALPADSADAAFAAAVIQLGAPDRAISAAEQIRATIGDAAPAARPGLVRLLGGAPPEMAAALLAPLLRDDDPTVVDAALRAAGNARAATLVPALCRLLEDRRSRPRAAAALRDMGNAAVEPLRKLLDGPSCPLDVKLSVVRLLGQSSQPRVAKNLLAALTADEPRLALGALRALVRLRSDVEVKIPSQPIVELFDDTARSVARELLLVGLGSWPTARAAAAPERLLERALRERVELSVSRLFNLLSLLHAPDDIRAAFDGIRSPLKSMRASSFEFLDNLLPRQRTAVLLPLLEDTDADQFRDTARRAFAISVEQRDEALRRICQGGDSWLQAVACWTVGDERLTDLRSELERLAEADDGVVAPVARRALASLAEQQQTEEPTMALTVVEKALKLKTVDVLQAASSEDLAQVAQIAEEVELSADEAIYAEGDAPDALFVVLGGAIRLTRGEEEMGTVGPGEAFGTWALFDEAPRVASATTVEPTVMLKVDREEFLELLADRVDIVQAIFKAMVARLRQLAEVVQAGP